MIGVYKIVNSVNGKVYIGSSKDIEDRWRQHSSSLRTNKHHSIKLQSAYNKYRESSFTYEVLEEREESVLLEREQYYLDLHRSFTIGYNICSIAGRVTGVKHTEEWKKKRSEQAKWKSFHTEQQIQRIRETKKGSTMSLDNRKKQSREILQIEDATGEILGEFWSIREAEKLLSIKNIGSVLLCQSRVSGGFRWEYKYPTEEERKRLVNYEKRKQENIESGHIRRIEKLLNRPKIQCINCKKKFSVMGYGAHKSLSTKCKNTQLK